jgi:beta propeller repeat protein
LTFIGRQVSLLYTQFSTRGEVEIIIDGGDPIILDQSNPELTFQNRWDSPIMEEGTHTIQLRHPGGSHYIDLNALIVSSPETNPPAAVTLNAVTGSNTGQVDFDWIAPGNDGDTGTAMEYILRYADTAIDSEATWDAATDVTGEPAPQIAGTAETLTLSNLTPGQTYYFALRTLDDAANLSDLSNSPSAEAKTLTPVGIGIYEQDNTNISYTGNWTTWEDARASGGSTSYTNDPTATASLYFSGRQVSLLYTSYASRGEIEIVIDGGAPVLLNQHSAALTFQNRWDSPLMDAGTHTIELRHPGGSDYIDLDALIVSSPESDPPSAVTLNASAGGGIGEVDLSWTAPGDDGNAGTATEYIVRYASSTIDSQSTWDAAAEVNGEPIPQVAGTAETMTIAGLTPGQTYYFALRTLDDSNNLSDLSNSPSVTTFAPPPVTEGTYQEDDLNITYTGNWTDWDTASASGGATRYSNDPNASASLTFFGGQVSLLYTGYASRGDIEISIDGSAPVLVDQKTSGLTYQNRWDSPTLDTSLHTITLRHPGGTGYIDLDALIISPHEYTGTLLKSRVQLTNKPEGEDYFYHQYPDTDGDYIVWQTEGRDATGIDLHQISTGLAIEIANDGEDPHIHGNNAVWECDGICLYQIDTGVTTKIESYGNSYEPKVYGDHVVYKSSADGDYEIYLYQISTGAKSQLTNNAFSNFSADIEGDHVIWIENEDGTTNLYLHQISTGTTINITNNQGPNVSPHISGDYIVWMCGDPEEVYLYQISTSIITQVTDNTVPDRVPQIEGNHIVWLQYPDGSDVEDIHLYAIDTGTSEKIASTDPDFLWGPEAGPSIKGNFIAWMSRDDSSKNDNEVYLYQISSGTLEMASDNLGGDGYAKLSNSHLVWSGQLYVSGDYDIFLGELNTPAGVGTYEENNTSITYTGNWTTWDTASASGGSTRYTNDTSASASLTFTGRQVSLLYTGYSSRGEIEIVIDGGAPVRVNQHTTGLTFQNRWDSPILDAGGHTIELRHPGGLHYIDIDALIVSSPESDPPAAVSLNAVTGTNIGEVDLNWTAPGDDGDTGTATEYIIRYADAAIDNQAKWDAATDITGEPTPQIAGTAESMTVSGLVPGQTLFFALRTLDDSGNLSDLSNSPSAQVQAPVPVGVGTYEENDANITTTGTWTPWNTPSASGGSTNYSNDNTASASLTFDGRQISLLYTGYASRGEIEIVIDGGVPVLLNQHSAALTFQNRWDSPLMDTGTHTIQLSHPGGSHYIDLDALIVSSPESDPPAAVTLAAVTGSETGEIYLNWTAPGDDGDTGTATEYILRYASTAIDSQSAWDAATDLNGEPAPQIAGTAENMTASGLVPGQTLFFALRTLDDSGNLSDLSNSPSAEAKAPTPVEVGTYEDIDTNIVYTGVWTPWNTASASGGATRYSNDATASATLTFNGRQVSLLYTSYVSRGEIEISIDGGAPVLLNQYGALSFQNRWDSPLMADGTHTIELRHPGGSHYIDIDALIVSSPETAPPAAVSLNAVTGSENGQVDIDWTAPGDDGNTGTATEYIVRYADAVIDSQAKWDAAADVNGEPAPQIAGTAESMTISGLTPGQTYYFALRTLDDSDNLSDISNSPSAAAYTPPPVGAGTYEEDDANIAYTGDWTSWSHASASGGAIVYTNQTNASATLTFTGRQVSLIFTRYTSRGEIEIVIDDGAPILLNQYGSSLEFQNRWDSPALDAGTHTICLRHPGGSHYIDIDAIEVFAEPQ